MRQRRKCKNARKENISFEASIDSFKYMVRKGRLNLNMEVRFIEEAKK